MQFVIEMVWQLMRPLRQNRFCLVLFFVILIVFVFMYYSPVIKQLEIIYFKHFHPHRKLGNIFSMTWRWVIVLSK
jgi:hypothetical protein